VPIIAGSAGRNERLRERAAIADRLQDNVLVMSVWQVIDLQRQRDHCCRRPTTLKTINYKNSINESVEALQSSTLFMTDGADEH